MPRCKYHNTKFKAKFFLQKYCLEDDECREAEWNYRASLKPIKIKEIGKPIPKVSSRQLEQLKKYRKIRDAFMFNKTCEAKLNGCTIKATDLHHAKGKIGDLLTDQRYFKALCRNCHSYLEVHPDEAKEKGFSLSRLENLETTN